MKKLSRYRRTRFAIAEFAPSSCHHSVAKWKQQVRGVHTWKSALEPKNVTGNTALWRPEGEKRRDFSRNRSRLRVFLFFPSVTPCVCVCVCVCGWEVTGKKRKVGLVSRDTVSVLLLIEWSFVEIPNAGVFEDGVRRTEPQKLHGESCKQLFLLYSQRYNHLFRLFITPIVCSLNSRCRCAWICSERQPSL